jgi:hypothetical protein
MAVVLKTLEGSDIPVDHRREGLDKLYAVEGADGSIRYFESGEEAAHVVVQLHEADDDQAS